MYLVKQTIRKQQNNQFYEDAKFLVYQTKMYGKKWKHEHTIVEGNVQRCIFVWATEEAYRTWYDDPTVTKFREARDAYNKNNGISYNEVTAFV